MADRSAALPLGMSSAAPGAHSTSAAMALGELRRDLRLIAEMIEPESRVLDIGCGDGALLAYLAREKGVDARGMELSQSGVNACVRHGLSVIQGDADRDLEAFPAGAFDVVVLSQTLQATRRPRHVVETLVRIGKRAIVSFPNFAYWHIRLSLLLRGRMPVSELLNNPWYDTPNIHLCTISDFVELARRVGATIESAIALDKGGRAKPTKPDAWGPNLMARGAIFLMRKS